MAIGLGVELSEGCSVAMLEMDEVKVRVLRRMKAAGAGPGWGASSGGFFWVVVFGWGSFPDDEIRRLGVGPQIGRAHV